ncbi:MAG TPA: AraC family transcriptional regulator, partial [Novosphingobium sp.]|nr:AraC family transcriptional regulator [Novosphingobium sp.]
MEPDRPLRFTTNAFPKEQRHDAWRFALKRFSLVLAAADEASLYGELIHFRSAAGIDFVRITATAQSLEVDFSQQPDCFWMALVLGGSGRAEGPEGPIELGDGDAICARGDKRALLHLAGEHRLLLMCLPTSLLGQRLKTPLPDNLRRIGAESGVARV